MNTSPSNIIPAAASTMPQLASAKEAAARVGLTVPRLLDLCESRHAPHYRVDDAEPKFRIGALCAWVRENLVDVCEGMPFPRQAQVWADHVTDLPPVCLRGLQNLQAMALPPRICGIYFLCLAGNIVYVGQSTDAYSRVAYHRGNKRFDAVYVWPVPPSELDRVEGAFIRLLKPCLNGNVGPVTDAETTERLAKLVEVTA